MKSSGAKNINDLAKLFGVSRQAARKWLMRGDWPFGLPPYSAKAVARIRGWLAANLSQPSVALGTAEDVDPAQMTRLTKAKLLLTVEKFKSVKAGREILMKTYHSVEDCDRRRLGKVKAVRAALLNLAAAMPFDPTTKYSGEFVKQTVHRYCVAVCESFANSHQFIEVPANTS